MFSTLSSSKVMIATAAVMLIMMMTAEGAAVTKHLQREHKRSILKTVPLHLGDGVVPTFKHFRPLQNASISPWTYNTTHDESLYPPTISEAHCLYRGCLNSFGQEDLNLQSLPIMHQVWLLRRVRSSESDSSYHFRLESRQVAVGCTCVRPIVKVQL